MTQPMTAPDRDDSEGLLLAQNIGLNSPDRFINREVSWLGFNERVLAEARRVEHPLLERVRYVAQTSKNSSWSASLASKRRSEKASKRSHRKGSARLSKWT